MTSPPPAVQKRFAEIRACDNVVWLDVLAVARDGTCFCYLRLADGTCSTLLIDPENLEPAPPEAPKLRLAVSNREERG